ncbi:hypothetical protein [Paenibacillus radicis (ex Xue et al. 2023)]|uniref:Uncharacterized protein n=1 Tax=Paenibacillus radicis (ex Xue et al. 2023) TaxID=2972489 RepID=A0ABT1YDN4_9BACL|nr:hypothetical protein [Paenibacillus radicis (ex Xue et al. 2023)]MCR8630875.1 hypothetical protein [Paenibacillus radicis (ex Xue et al. 2023)]
MTKYQNFLNKLNKELESDNESLAIHIWSTDSFLKRMDPAQVEDWKEQFIMDIAQTKRDKS